MFEIGDDIVSSSNGVCHIKEVVKPDFVQDKNKEYFLITSDRDKSAKLYIPVDNMGERFRKIMTADDIKKFLIDIKNIDVIRVENEKEREKLYQEAIRSCDPMKTVSVIKTLYFRNKKRNEDGKKSTVVDERYFKMAEELLYSEIGFVLNIESEEAKKLIQKYAE